jgi:hypothetical protein
LQALPSPRDEDDDRADLTPGFPAGRFTYWVANDQTRNPFAPICQGDAEDAEETPASSGAQPKANGTVFANPTIDAGAFIDASDRPARPSLCSDRVSLREDESQRSDTRLGPGFLSRDQSDVAEREPGLWHG